MKVIVRPRQSIYILWNKPSKYDCTSFRLMRYVMRVDRDDTTLLHNVVTGQLVALDQNETAILDGLPALYSPSFKQLVDDHFLVPECYDEHQIVLGLSKILFKFAESQRKPGMTHFTILPTTACNARCYYCFEQGTARLTMSEETGKRVIDYIADTCGSEKEVRLSWFGGEPTIATERIDQICKGLKKRGIKYSSDITTNGYLLDDRMIERAVDLWNLKSAMICVDGAENNYNKIKNYVNAKDSPYQKVMHNIGVLIKNKIHVTLRMNFDLNNYLDFDDIINDVAGRYNDSKYLKVHAHPVIGEYPDHTGKINHANPKWFEEKTYELNETARKAGYLTYDDELPSLSFHGCQASSDHSVTITPQGNLVKCPEQFEEDQVVGNVDAGITNDKVLQMWKKLRIDSITCNECELYPHCMKLEHCSASTKCYHKKEIMSRYQYTMIQLFKELCINN